MGGYSIAFDLVSREYGWTDDQILDLTVRRFRQIVAAINRRRYMDRRERIALTSWQTRTLAQYIAGGYWVEGKNPALDQASMLAFDKIEKAQLEEANEAVADTPMPSSEPKPGSYERLMGSLGNPSMWR